MKTDQDSTPPCSLNSEEYRENYLKLMRAVGRVDENGNPALPDDIEWLLSGRQEYLAPGCWPNDSTSEEWCQQMLDALDDSVGVPDDGFSSWETGN